MGKKSQLPPDYQPIEYFVLPKDAHGIATGIHATDTNEIRCVFKFEDVTEGWAIIFSAYTNEYTPTQRIITPGKNNGSYNKCLAYFNVKAGTGWVAVENFKHDEWHDATLKENTLVLDGRTYKLRNKEGSTTTEFALGTSIPSYYTATTFYYKLFEIRDKGVLKCRMIPARDSQGKQCLYDVVRKKAFYQV